MKSLTTFALVVLSCVPAMAQLGGLGGGGRPQQPQGQQDLDVEFLEMEQEADKAALKEALLLQARLGMKPVSGGESEQKRHAEEVSILREFINKKKDAIKDRSADLTKGRAAKAAPAGKLAQTDRQATIKESAQAQVEVQLLQAKLGLLQEPLTKAISELAEAELAASADERQRGKAEVARKEYEKVKGMYAEQSKQLVLEQQKAGLFGGMGGGMGMGGMGMGGGFR